MWRHETVFRITGPLGTHNDVVKWKYFPRYWRFVRAIHQSPVNSPNRGQVTRNCDVFLDLRLNSWANHRDAGGETPLCPSWRHWNGPPLLEPMMTQSTNTPDLDGPSHDDVIKWKHFPRNWPFVWWIHRSRWIPHTKASDAELWCFLWSASE